ncbi:MAG: RcnB family protein [Sphingomicrobium sp.]
MRKIIISLLLASVAAAPAMALDRTDRDAAREERQKAREVRRQSSEESQPAQAEAPTRPDRPDRPDRVRQGTNDAQVPAAAVEAPAGGQRSGRQQPGGQRVDRQRLDRRVDQNTGQAPVRDARERVDARRQQWDQSRAERLARQQEIRDRRPPVVSPTPRPGTQPPPPPPSARPSANPAAHWSTNHWRNDRRYNWYKHRNKYWWLFQLGWYNDPFGWGYQPYGIGWRMWPSYYSSHYWLSDPWQYRLPYAPAGTRWIRYWDDAVLVDLWSGQVVDVIYNFFW